MTQDGKPVEVPPDKRPKRDIVALHAGDRVRLSDGTLREIVTNPHDGVWLIVKEIDDADAGEEMALITEIDGPA
ncbi:MAG TPA: hypothetical protein VGP41_14815 [Candidatus Lustribacter sp.]|jgi:hypothetical protein|nr:hypothetical protein [Candidatus Lustribacter sp.]